MKAHTLGGIIISVGIAVAITIVKEVWNVKMDFIGGVIIGLLAGHILPVWKYFFNTEHKNPIIFPCPNKPILNAGVINNKNRYPKGFVNINFISEYTGKLKNGYFVNEIVFAENAQYNRFPSHFPYLNEDCSRALLPCNDTIDNIDSKKGKLNGCREYRFTWPLDMDFQSDLLVGEYKVKCMVFNENHDEPLSFNESKFKVIESSNSNKPFNYNDNPNFQ